MSSVIEWRRYLYRIEAWFHKMQDGRQLKDKSEWYLYSVLRGRNLTSRALGYNRRKWQLFGRSQCPVAGDAARMWPSIERSNEQLDPQRQLANTPVYHTMPLTRKYSPNGAPPPNCRRRRRPPCLSRISPDAAFVVQRQDVGTCEDGRAKRGGFPSFTFLVSPPSLGFSTFPILSNSVSLFPADNAWTGVTDKACWALTSYSDPSEKEELGLLYTHVHTESAPCGIRYEASAAVVFLWYFEPRNVSDDFRPSGSFQLVCVDQSVHRV